MSAPRDPESMSAPRDPAGHGEARTAAHNARAWPFEEARKLLRGLERHGARKTGAALPEHVRAATGAAGAGAAGAGQGDKPVIFQTGYGPSGPPHIGTFCEVARTTMVRNAFSVLDGNTQPAIVICFSDDCDGLRKVPEGIENDAVLQQALDRPLYAVPDPSGGHESFAAANNARLAGFLDAWGYSCHLVSAHECYSSGLFDPALRRVLECHDEIMELILPTLRAGRRSSYAPFLPICPQSGKVLQVPVLATDCHAGTIVYRHPQSGKEIETPVTGGAVKCQWKVDWAMRWYAFGVDYEMAGKDLTDSVALSSKICHLLGARPPEGFNYELFLDAQGLKISKSKGNGLSMEEWLAYAPRESLTGFMYQKPKTAKRLHFDVIPRAVDEFLGACRQYDTLDAARRLASPLWHIYNGRPPQIDVPLSFALILKLAAAANTDDKDTLWGFVRRYNAELGPRSHPVLDALIDHAMRYFEDFVRPARQFRAPDRLERAALQALDGALGALERQSTAAPDAVAIQNAVYEVGRGFERYHNRERPGPDGQPGVSLSWFEALYSLLTGQKSGPRFGSFVALYGIGPTRQLIVAALARVEPAPAPASAPAPAPETG